MTTSTSETGHSTDFVNRTASIVWLIFERDHIHGVSTDWGHRAHKQLLYHIDTRFESCSFSARNVVPRPSQGSKAEHTRLIWTAGAITRLDPKAIYNKSNVANHVISCSLQISDIVSTSLSCE